MCAAQDVVVVVVVVVVVFEVGMIFFFSCNA